MEKFSLRQAPDGVILIGLIGLLSGLLLVYGASLYVMPEILLIYGIIFLGNIPLAVGLRWIASKEQMDYNAEVVDAFRNWLPLIWIPIIYDNLAPYTSVFRSTSIDTILADMDMDFWGVQPTVWMEQFANPLLTDFLSIAYAAHIPLPLSLLYALYVLGSRSHFREFATVFIFCNMVGFMLYLMFPAGPPRFYLSDAYTLSALPSYTGFYEWMQGFWDELNPVISHSSFPSLHVAYATLAMVYAFRRDHWPRAWRWMAPLYSLFAISLWVATVYLRHHWTPDILAGWALALFSIVAVRLILVGFRKYEEAEVSP